MTPSTRNELPQPLRSILEDIAASPVPEELMHYERHLKVPASRKENAGRSSLAIAISLLALCLCIAALIFYEIPPANSLLVKQEKSSIPPIQPPKIPPPTLWAYRRAAGSAEALDDLLTQHAAVLLQPGPVEDPRPFRFSFGKEEL
jgi:hypothetical protein